MFPQGTTKRVLAAVLAVGGCTEMSGTFCEDVPRACVAGDGGIADGGAGDTGARDGGLSDGGPSDSGVAPDGATPTFRVRGQLFGATAPVRLALAGIAVPEEIVVAAPGTFEFAARLPDRAGYTVTVLGQPAREFCSVIGGDGRIAAADVASVQVVCAADRLVFLSSLTYTGAIGGIAGADARCQALAVGAGLRGMRPSRFLAWYSGGTVTPASRFSRSTVPYVLVNGTVVANGWSDLTDGTLAHAINLTEGGMAGPRLAAGNCTNAVRTGTTAQGSEVAGESCLAGTSDAMFHKSALGDIEQTGNPPGVPGAFTDACSAPNCHVALPIYCFEQ